METTFVCKLCHQTKITTKNSFQNHWRNCNKRKASDKDPHVEEKRGRIVDVSTPSLSCVPTFPDPAPPFLEPSILPDSSPLPPLLFHPSLSSTLPRSHPSLSFPLPPPASHCSLLSSASALSPQTSIHSSSLLSHQLSPLSTSMSYTQSPTNPSLATLSVVHHYIMFMSVVVIICCFLSLIHEEFLERKDHLHHFEKSWKKEQLIGFPMKMIFNSKVALRSK